MYLKKQILILIIIGSCLNIFGQKGNISIFPKPKWVNKIDTPDIGNKNDIETSGFYYQLIDFQSDIDLQSYFSHYTIEVINNEGIQQISDINVDFDPSYQKLVFHNISIIRDGKTIKKLFLDQIKTIQRETSMERFLYDGTITAFVNITDVRVGDIIDYSYTIEGSNPIYENKYHSKLYFQYSIPIHHLYNRIRISKNRNLYIKSFNNAEINQPVFLDNKNEYIWEHTDISPLIYDTNTPSWYDPFPNVSISEYNSWKEVSNQYSKYYYLNKDDKNKFIKNIKQLFSGVPKDSLIDVIRTFVQDEIRYLGFEGGINSHKPDNPIRVLNQRYGDCKAKSFLLSEAYHVFDIEAYPTLVSSYNGINIPEELPSPNVFNHCIVQVKKDNAIYYIDPTISNQGGSLKNLSIPNYNTGLVLKKEENKLSDIKFKSKSTLVITEEFDVDNIGGNGYLDITSKYTGSSADDQRAYFAKQDINKIQKEYLNFYSALYPSIKEFSKIEVIDNRLDINEITIKESYFIDSLWTKSSENENILISEFYPLNIESYVNIDKSPNRDMPYHVKYPLDISHKIIINLPEKWNLSPENRKLESDVYEYHFNVEYDNQKIEIDHKYKTLKSFITPEETKSFIGDHEKILNNLSYQLTYNKGYTENNPKTSWILIFFSISILLISTFFAYKVYYNYNLPSKNTDGNSQKIGGWLILIVIGLIFTPIKILYEVLKNSQDFFGMNTWVYISLDHSSFSELFLSLLIIFELIYNSAFFVFSILIILLFFKRRTILPNIIIIFYSSSFIFLFLDSILAFSLNESFYSEIEKMQAYKEIGKSFIKVVIWIPYFLFSKRVKSTFTEEIISLKKKSVTMPF